MATKAIGGESAHVTNPLQFTLTPGMAPAAPLMRMLSRFDRTKVEAFVEISISLLDLIDGDADLEENGDLEPAGDERDAAWIEWHTRGRHKRTGVIAEQFTSNEDDEADGAEDDFIEHRGNFGPGCPIADPDVEHCGREPDDGY